MKARRPNLYLTMALRRRYSQALGHVEREPTDERRADLNALARVLRMFNPGEDVSALKPIRPYRPQRSKYLADAFTVLRQANEPLTARAVARRVLERRGVPLVRNNLQRVECSLHAVLERMEGDGVVRIEGEPKRWQIG